MKDYQIINKETAIKFTMAGKTVKAMDFDDEILYEVQDLQLFELSRLLKKPNLIFVVKGKYELGID